MKTEQKIVRLPGGRLPRKHSVMDVGGEPWWVEGAHAVRFGDGAMQTYVYLRRTLGVVETTKEGDK